MTRRKRGEEVPRPKPWRVLLHNTASARGWSELEQQAVDALDRVWVAITMEPRSVQNPSRQHRSKATLGAVKINGTELERWQYEVTSGGADLVRNRRRAADVMGHLGRDRSSWNHRSRHGRGPADTVSGIDSIAVAFDLRSARPGGQVPIGAVIPAADCVQILHHRCRHRPVLLVGPNNRRAQIPKCCATQRRSYPRVRPPQLCRTTASATRIPTDLIESAFPATTARTTPPIPHTETRGSIPMSLSTSRGTVIRNKTPTTMGARTILFPLWQTQTAVQRRNAVAPDTKLESSGGLRRDQAGDYARTGVDYLAVGALTHSVPALDLGLDM